jgi:hypothetical protein
MPANINAYIGREAAWHRLGIVTGHHMTWAEVRGLDYVVFKSQLHDGLGRPVNAWGTFRWNRVDKLAGNREAVVFLGVVGEDYVVIQHCQGFQIIDALVASVDNAHYETAGALGKGERVWGLADLEDGAEKESSTRRNNVLADILARYESNDGNAFPEQRGTAYNLLNAITEYTDHARSSRGGNGNGRVESAMFGSGERLKAEALDLILETANGLPVMAAAPVYPRIPVKSDGGNLLDQIISESAS